MSLQLIGIVVPLHLHGASINVITITTLVATTMIFFRKTIPRNGGPKCESCDMSL